MIVEKKSISLLFFPCIAMHIIDTNSTVFGHLLCDLLTTSRFVLGSILTSIFKDETLLQSQVMLCRLGNSRDLSFLQ